MLHLHIDVLKQVSHSYLFTWTPIFFMVADPLQFPSITSVLVSSGAEREGVGGDGWGGEGGGEERERDLQRGRVSIQCLYT